MIIGLAGYARSGKDTVANILVNDFGFERVAFADPIRDLLFELNPLVNGVRLQDMVTEYGWEITKSQIEVRRLLQNLGVGARKTFGSNFWVDQAMRRIKSPNVVITDVRFKNEADWLRMNYAELWRVRRNGVTAVNNHVSEHDLDDYPVDYVVDNEGSIEDLSTLIHERCQNLILK
jgi:hypothetical protein